LSVPYTLLRLGWLAGLLILASLAWLSAHTSKLLCRCVGMGHHHKTTVTYSDLGEDAFGAWGRRAVDVILYVDLVASSALFLVFIATNLDGLFPYTLPVSSWICLVAFALWPTVLMRMGGLAWLSAFGSYVMVAMVLAIVLTLFSSAPEDLHANRYEVARFDSTAIGNQVFAFAMHGTLLTVFQDMQRPQDAERMFDRVYLTGFLLKFIVGTSGYFLFAQNVSDQVTLDLPNQTMRLVITIAVTLKKFLTYALPLEPVARSLEAPPLRASRLLSRTSLVALTVAVALWLPKFGLLQSLIGSLCAGCLVLVFPVAFYLKLNGPRMPAASKAAYAALLGVSVVLVGLAAAASLQEAMAASDAAEEFKPHG